MSCEWTERLALLRVVDNVSEENIDVSKELRLNTFAALQARGDVRRKHLSKHIPLLQFLVQLQDRLVWS
jgi:hypothetical protein